jgi:hypothetical protein
MGLNGLCQKRLLLRQSQPNEKAATIPWTPRTAALVLTVFEEDNEAEELPDCETKAIPRRT